MNPTQNPNRRPRSSFLTRALLVCCAFAVVGVILTVTNRKDKQVLEVVVEAGDYPPNSYVGICTDGTIIRLDKTGSLNSARNTSNSTLAVILYLDGSVNRWVIPIPTTGRPVPNPTTSTDENNNSIVISKAHHADSLDEEPR